MDPTTLIETHNLRRVYGNGDAEVRALDGVDLKVQRGEFVALMGPSGSGKSTLMNIIGCLDRPTSGKYLLEGQEVSKMNKNQLAQIRNIRIGFVFQNFNLLARTTALENTELPLLYSDVSSKKAREMAITSLAQVGLEGRELHKTNQLSGGEMQRVAIARALVNNPSLLLADEPTGNLDTKTGNDIMAVLKKLNKDNNITIVLVTHDPEVAEAAEKTIFLRDGEIERIDINGKQ